MSSTPPSESHLSRALVEAWRSDVASPAELRRGYTRFNRRPTANKGLVRLASGLALGLLLGVGLAQAASVAHSRWVAAREVTVRATAKPRVPARARKGTASLVPHPPLPAAPEPSVAAAPVPSARAAFDGSSRLALPSSTSSAPYVQQQWQQAAAALRANDFTRAQSALLEVERSAGGSERDAARLARAQLLASHGRTAEALALLRELAEHAQSRVVRGQSAGLLARLQENGDPHRSTEAPAVTKP
jgi:hypothetical protein